MSDMSQPNKRKEVDLKKFIHAIQEGSDHEYCSQSTQQQEEPEVISEEIVTLETSSQNDQADIQNRCEQQPADIITFQTWSETENAIKQFERKTKTRYPVYRKSAGFNSEEITLKGRKILFQDNKSTKGRERQIHFDGIPFIIMGTKQFDCAHHKDRYIEGRKRKRLEAGVILKKFVKSKKGNCPCEIIVRDIVAFPEFKITRPTEKIKRTCCTKLKAQFEKALPRFERFFITQFPSPNDHVGHEVEVVKPPSDMCRELTDRIAGLSVLLEGNTDLMEDVNNTLLSLVQKMESSLVLIQVPVDQENPLQPT
uniref:Uncharacterized protein n=1 Tax=Clytia hemisphaerica TaxID=252671 RepID=A0A7M5V938_9CNID